MADHLTTKRRCMGISDAAWYTKPKTPKEGEGMNKKLVDANTIGEGCCCKPEPGDLVRIKVDGVRCVAFCNKYINSDTLYYSTQSGRMYYGPDVTVLEILGKCVFSIYV